MKLLLVQHAEAFSKEQYIDRPLTEHGALEALSISGFLKPLNLSVADVWHSEKTRALQTAKVICTALRCPGQVHMQPGLNPDDDPEPVARAIEQEGKDLMIVGHLPFLERLAALLLTGRQSPSIVRFQRTAVLCLEKIEDQPWRINWMISPQLIESAATAQVCSDR